ncbi:uncharacterized protein SOCE26_020170 [Sorangium cellulosum]|uniref:Uncharacterized protein n=1 Tax=Sorangium cellulosum TaxID=56 RepID=A0A2L0EMU6_SORCE|nr:hypothetical protein [Sorangium cellulosum]AUX40616.1 uncharacterized protein SOCE26_020170 [Sorangium cellulosum]
MTQEERNSGGRGPASPVASPPGYGGLSEGSVGDPTASGQKGTAPEAAGSQESAGSGGERGEARGQRDVVEGGAEDAVDTPRNGGSGNEVIPGVLDDKGQVSYESSAEHKSSWPDEGGTGEAGAG